MAMRAAQMRPCAGISASRYAMVTPSPISGTAVAYHGAAAAMGDSTPIPGTCTHMGERAGRVAVNPRRHS